ncbi:MAG: hypothetical protein AAGA85_22275 [Bacteroidota bacterium]
MSSFRVRPRFKHLVKMPASEVESVIMSSIKEERYVYAEGFLQGHADLKIPVEERHYWSPQLHVSTEQTADGTIIRGLYGPNPTVWGLFFFGYLTLGVLFFFAGFWGMTKLTLGHTANILWALPILAGLALTLYIIAQMGQKIGADQMYRLHYFYEGIFEDKVAIT